MRRSNQTDQATAARLVRGANSATGQYLPRHGQGYLGVSSPPQANQQGVKNSKPAQASSVFQSKSNSASASGAQAAGGSPTKASDTSQRTIVSAYYDKRLKQHNGRDASSGLTAAYARQGKLQQNKSLGNTSSKGQSKKKATPGVQAASRQILVGARKRPGGTRIDEPGSQGSRNTTLQLGFQAQKDVLLSRSPRDVFHGSFGPSTTGPPL